MRLRAAERHEVALLADKIETEPEATLSRTQLTLYQQRQQLLSIWIKHEPIGLLAYRELGNEAELDLVFVCKKQRGQGYATRALRRWHRFLKRQEVAAIYLELRHGNQAAERLYKALGYQSIGRRRNYYKRDGAGFDAVLMKKAL